MFGNNKDIEEIRQQLEEYAESNEALKKDLEKLKEELEDLKTQVSNLQERALPSKSESQKEAVFEAGTLTKMDVEPQRSEPIEQVFYLAAPANDGLFAQLSSSEQIGKSIYKMVTKDGLNGNFILMDTPDAIATAMISVSQFIKPVCKVDGNIHQQPRHIITEEEGTVTKEGEAWRVSRKAIVRFE
ncbi:MAG: hypothetical protein LKG25_00405 [Prevotella sp.]|jgi:hypothetical protein|nr:hypothetical protein [Prevotella sp.]MCI1281037.1 hypothetical protein [Prevotella sp.]